MITSGSNSHKIEKWLGAVVDSAAAPDDGVDLFLYHVGPDEPARLLVSRSLTDAPTREEMNDLVEDIDRQALEDSETQGWTTQRYVLRARDRKNGRDLGSVSLKYASNALVGEGGSFSDSMPANARGVAGLAMQQAENCQKGLLAGVGMVLEHASRALQRCDAQAEKQTEALFRAYALHEATVGRQMERELLAAAQKQEAELRFRKETAQIDRDEFLLHEGVEKLGSILPIIANRFMGNKADVAVPTTRDALLSSLLASLTPEQRESMSDSQRCTVVELEDAVANVQKAGRPSAASAKGEGERMREDEKEASESVKYIERILIPWAMERLQKGESVEPRLHSEEGAQRFALVVRNLVPTDYATLVGDGSPLGVAERKAFAAMADAMKSGQAARSTPDQPSTGTTKAHDPASKENR
jgi:hypothetical protein